MKSTYLIWVSDKGEDNDWSSSFHHTNIFRDNRVIVRGEKGLDFEVDGEFVFLFSKPI